MIPAVNFHLWQPCNMRCRFCFAGFEDVKETVLPRGHLTREQALEVVWHLAETGFEKITFAGGEPTLCPWLGDLIRAAKEAGMTTMIVTNGTKLTDAFLSTQAPWLDWVAISIDSLDAQRNKQMGRAISGQTILRAETYHAIIERVHSYGYGLKINTVVNALNYDEDMNELIRRAAPQRWKVLQVLPVKGQNDSHSPELSVTREQFAQFVQMHAAVGRDIPLIAETNTMMRGSYAMVDPAGRFYDNTKGYHTYSRSILEIGARLAIQQVDYSLAAFAARRGLYLWQR